MFLVNKEAMLNSELKDSIFIKEDDFKNGDFQLYMKTSSLEKGFNYRKVFDFAKNETVKRMLVKLEKVGKYDSKAENILKSIRREYKYIPSENENFIILDFDDILKLQEFSARAIDNLFELKNKNKQLLIEQSEGILAENAGISAYFDEDGMLLDDEELKQLTEEKTVE